MNEASGARSGVVVVATIGIAIIASMVSGLAVAIFNHYASRKRTGAEIEKLSLETEKLRAELHYRLSSSTEVIIYNSSESLPLGHDFRGNEGQLYANGSHYGGKARAELSFIGENREILSIRRTNNEGKYQVSLGRYSYNDSSNNRTLPENVAISGMRLLRVSCQVRAVDSPHVLSFEWKARSNRSSLDDQRVSVVSKSWTPVDLYFQINPARECYLRIDDYYSTGNVPSEVQVRRIVVAERKSYD